MEEENKIIKIPKTFSFYLERGVKFLRIEEYEKAITNFNVAYNKVNSYDDKMNCHHLLAQAYLMSGNPNLSLIHYFILAEYKPLYAKTLLGLSDNFLMKEKKEPYLYYLQLINKETSSDDIKTFVSRRMKALRPKKMKLVSNNIPQENLTLKRARNLLLEKRFSEALQYYKTLSMEYDQQVRSEMVGAYLATFKSEEAIKLLETYGSDSSIEDLFSLLFIYSYNGEKEKCDEVKKKIRNIKITSYGDSFRAGLAFAQTGDLHLGIEYMERAFFDFGKKHYDIYLRTIYAIALIDDEQFEKARRQLIDLKAYDPMNSYIYDYYMKICFDKKKVKLQYTNNLPYREILNVENTVDKFMTFSDDELLVEFKNNKGFFYYLFTMNDYIDDINAPLYLRLSAFNGEDIDEFFDYCFVMESLSEQIKFDLLISRLWNSNKKIVFVLRISDLLTKITLPENIYDIKQENIFLFEGIINSIIFFTKKLKVFIIDYKNLKDCLNLLKGEEKLDKDFVSVLLTYLMLGKIPTPKNKKQIITLDEILAYFNINKNEFIKWTDKLDLKNYIK